MEWKDGIDEKRQAYEDLPLLSISKPKNHRLLGLMLVAISAFTFSLMSACIKFESFTISSMETVFWRSGISWVFNLVS